MSRAWNAPAAAYGLAAQWAQDAAGLRGGGDGRVPPGQPPPIGKTWHDLTRTEQRDVLAALGAQAVSALCGLRSQVLAVTRAHVEVVADLNIRWFEEQICGQSRAALYVLLGQDEGPWSAPECPHCAAWLAVALIQAQVCALEGTGIADAAAALHSLVGIAELPEPRTGNHDA